MIKSLYNKYFQKSRSFLFPALGISKQQTAPLQTFISLDKTIIPTDRKLICLFDHKETLKYEEFENTLLLGNPLYHNSDIKPGKPSIYIFDFEVHNDDWEKFLNGQYSKLSEVFKKAIRNYYGEKTPEYAYIDTYLYPDKYFELYSNLLDVPIELVKQNGELCNIYDPEKEKLIYSTKELEKSITIR